MGVIKYFRHILMGHEIFFKVFDGPQNVFLRFVCIILFFELRGWGTKYPKKDKTCYINHIHTVDIR